MKENFRNLKKEIKYLAFVLIGIFVALKIAFFRENFYGILRVSLVFFYMFILPGYSIMLYWMEKLEISERLAIGSLASAGILGITSYYLGILGVNIKHHGTILPALLIAAGLLLWKFLPSSKIADA